jgi:hypothetical protein
VAAILKMATARNFSMAGIYSRHHNLPTYEMSLKSANVEYTRHQKISTGLHFQNCRNNTAKIQHCSISKVAFDLFFEFLCWEKKGVIVGIYDILVR